MKETCLVVALLTTGCLQVEPDELVPTPGLCTVIRSDKATGFVTNRFQFNEHGLVRHEVRTSPHSYSIRVNRYDGAVVTSASIREFNKAGESEPYLSWQDMWAVYDEDQYRSIELQFFHDEEDRLVYWSSQSVTRSGDQSLRIETTRRITYQRGRKARMERTDWASNRPDHTHQRVVTYEYRSGDEQLAEVTTHTVGTDHSYTVNFFYDEEGRLLGSTMDDGPLSKFHYDERGRLTRLTGSNGYTWNDEDQIVARSVGKTTRYGYQDGRLHEATFEDGAGYVQDYSAECPAGFSHPLVTPNVLYHQHYEGPPLHYTWSAF